MKELKKKAVLFAPFWRQGNHVGNYRVDRFRRWLIDEGYSVVVIRAGSSSGERKESWGQEITVRDPVGTYRDTTPDAPAMFVRKPNKARRWVSNLLFNPDPTVAWARSAARDPRVIQVAQGAKFILSSSPPESAHVGAWLLSRRAGVPHIVDMRDGWLDEPLRPLLRSSALRRWRERRLETLILGAAKAIQVTSDAWKELLCARYPALAPRVRVLTNGYPRGLPSDTMKLGQSSDDGVILVHAGGFLSSRMTQSPELLLEPLLPHLLGGSQRGVIRLIGPLSGDERKIVEAYSERFMDAGWRIEAPGQLTRLEVLALLPKASGLLLLAATHAALPSKLFEYLPTGKPIFAVTYRNSAVWRICSQLPQATLVEIGSEDGLPKPDRPFYQLTEARIPRDYSEEFLAKKFMEII